ncbi:MAG: arsenate reductase (azurin) small subunit [Rhodospirillales bacterium]|jgi:arsenite oxidase small subunit|nr:arsenate reductase (azurin) small subunit [Rhodospirillales bacterium]MDP6643137.1 arsenate reductase (azurin) small subunit [Rhodospirillales bacterium]MDP6840076.1 arsenate reductase (azurin) small subunit [Rhodospirillales bacterium]|tara:strand:- start:420 stop:989 length:570 start_codon:yes stop_codon:yes gene_type:complete
MDTQTILKPDNAVAEIEQPGGACHMSRRQFLFAAGTTSVVMVSAGPGLAQIPAMVASYPKKRIARLSDLKQDKPINFQYPDKGEYSASMIVKLGVEAGGGIGPDRDVVAFNYFCTHQGGNMSTTYKGDTKSLGACPLHLSTYDLTRHGILISGQAYQNLPQVLLELNGNDIYAVAVFGLIYGRFDNLQG